MKVGTDGSHRVPAVFLILLLPFFLLLSACPPVVDSTLATSAQDKQPPRVVITSPKIGATYSGTMAFVGTAEDDAVAVDDNKGTLSTISYAVANNALLQGKIKIDSKGNATADTTYGTGVITWDNSSKGYTFNISTLGVTGTMVVTVTAVDVNGNSSSASVQLQENSGPVVTLTSPTSTKFVKGTTIVTLAGTLSNSKDDTSHADNVNSLTWQVSLMGWSGSLAIGGATSTVSVNNVGFNPSHTYAFTYDPSTRIFTTQFYINSGASSILPVDVIATDYNGHKTTNTLYLVEDAAGPQLYLDSPVIDYYTSIQANFTTSRHITGSIIPNATNPVSTVKYQVQKVGSTGTTNASSIITLYDASATPSSQNTFVYDTNTGIFSFDIDWLTAQNAWSAHGDMNVTVMATNSKNVESDEFVTLHEDSTGPTISPITMTSNNSVNPTTMAKENDVVTLNFTLSDAGSGFPIATPPGPSIYVPVVKINGGTVTATLTSMNATSTAATYTASYNVPSGTAIEGPISLSIVAVDAVNNSSSATSVTTPPPITIDNTQPNVVLSSKEDTALTASDRIVRGAQKVHITATFSETVVAPTITFTGMDNGTFAMSGAGATWTYTWTVPTGSSADGAVNLAIAATDLAGNTIGTTTGDTSYTIDNTAPTGYSASIDQSTGIDTANQTNMGFTIANAEAGTTYGYSIKSSGGPATVTGSGTIPGTAGYPGANVLTTDVTGINVSSLLDGTLTLTVTLTDVAGNPGSAVTDGGTVVKDSTAPSGYSVAITEAQYSPGSTTMNFTISSAEQGTTYYYTVTSDGPVNATGTTATLSGNAAVGGTVGHPGTTTSKGVAVDISSLYDGNLTLKVYLVDSFNNGSSANQVTAPTTPIKDTAAPSGYSVAITETQYSSSSTTMNFTISSAEQGTTYYYTVTSDGPANSTGTAASKSGNAAVGGTVGHPGTPTSKGVAVDISSLYDGNLTLTVYLVDSFGNGSSANQVTAPTTPNKDTVAPSGYSVAITETQYSSSSTTMNFTIASAEQGTTYYYTVTSDGPVNSTGTAASKSGNAAVGGSVGHPGTPTSKGVAVDISSLYDGNLTLKVYLKDAAGNGSSTNQVTAPTTPIKDTAAPSGYSVAITEAQYSPGSTTMNFTISSAEQGTTYYYTVTSDGPVNATGTTATLSGNAAVGGTVGHPGTTTSKGVAVDISSLYDGNLTLKVYLVDSFNNGSSANQVTAPTTPIKDTAAPSGYSVAITETQYSSSSTTMNFTISSAEQGTTYYYTVTSDGPVNSTGTAASKSGNAAVGGTVGHPGTTTSKGVAVDISSLYDGNLTLTVYLVDSFGNGSSANQVTAPTTPNKDTVAPSGYSVAITETQYSSSSTTMNFTIASAEQGTTYYYTVTSDGPVNSTGTAASKSGNAAVGGSVGHPGTPTSKGVAVDISSLYDGNLTLKVYLKDAAGNGSSTNQVTAPTTPIKDTAAPSGYSVAITEAQYSPGSTTMNFTISSAEQGTTYYYTVTSDGPVNATGTTATLSGNAAVGGTVGHPGTTTSKGVAVDISSLYDGNLTLKVYLVDSFNNGSSANQVTAPTTPIKDTAAPSGYSVAITETQYSSSSTTMNFTISSAEQGTTYYYTVTSDGPVNSTGTAASKSGNAAVGGTVGHPGTTTSKGVAVDISSLYDGNLTLTVYLVDSFGNGSSANQVTAPTTPNKDTVAPSGYSVAITETQYSSSSTTMNFTIASAEQGTTYYYTVTSDGPVNSTGTAASKSGNAAVGGTVGHPGTTTSKGVAVDISSLYDGNLTLTVYLVDSFNNGSSTNQVTAPTTPIKDTVAPSGYSAAITEARYNTLGTTMNFTIAGAEQGTTYYYTVTSDGPVNSTGTAASKSGNAAVGGTAGHPGTTTSKGVAVDISSLYDGNLTLKVYLVDSFGNGSSTNQVTAPSTPLKDTVVPTITSLAISGSGSTTATIVFSEKVFKDSAGTTPIDATSISVTDQTTPADTSTPSLTSYTAATKTAVYGLTWNTPPTKTPTADTLVAAPASATAIYDIAGNPMSTGSAGTDTAKLLAALGIHVSPVIAGSAKSANPFLRIGSWIQQAIAGSVQQGAMAKAAGEEASAPATAVSLSTTAATRDQFYTPLMANAQTTASTAQQAPNAASPLQASPIATQTQATARAQPEVMAMAPAGPRTVTSNSGFMTQPAGAYTTKQAVEPSPIVPPWWMVLIGVLAVSVVTVGAWAGLKFVRERGEK